MGFCRVKLALHPQKTAVTLVHKRLSERPFLIMAWLSSNPRALILHSHDWRTGKGETDYCSLKYNIVIAPKFHLKILLDRLHSIT